MNNYKLNESDILTIQDWTFPSKIAYGPGRLKEIGVVCNNLNIKNPFRSTYHKLHFYAPSYFHIDLHF